MTALREFNENFALKKLHLPVGLAYEVQVCTFSSPCEPKNDKQLSFFLTALLFAIFSKI